MSKGIDPTMIGLLAAGGYGVYAYSKGMWPFSVAPVATVTPTVNYVPTKTTPTQPPAPPPPTPCATGYHRANNWDANATCLQDVVIGKDNPKTNPTYCDLGTPGWGLVDGRCQQVQADKKQEPAVTLTTLQKIAALGGSGKLNADQWCYFYQQVTGTTCPDPGTLDLNAYNRAGIVLEDGTIGDRTTPTDVNTWWNLMSSNLGLSGLGEFSSGVSPLLIAAGVAALMFLGGK